MSSFRNIDYGRLLYETLRAYYSVNAAGEMSILYKYLAAFVAPFQAPFDAYSVYRKKEALIASCKWQIGQLTNVLNFLYDSVYKRIFITQAELQIIADPMFEYPSIHSDGTFEMLPVVSEPTFDGNVSATHVTINIPSTVNQSDLIATVEQIRMQGIPYEIKVFPV
jgi:hypothetical protein